MNTNYQLDKYGLIYDKFGRTLWTRYVGLLAQIIDEPVAIVGAYLDANPWNGIAQRLISRTGINYALNGGYPIFVSREFVEATTCRELDSLKSSVRVYKARTLVLAGIIRRTNSF